MLRGMINVKFIAFLAAAALLAGCASRETTSGAAGPETAAPAAQPPAEAEVSAAPSEEVTAESLPSARPGTEEDLIAYAGGDRVFFGFDRYDLTADARAMLKRQAEWLEKNSAVTVTIEGHCDERGTREYNLALGARRAAAVKAYLVALGVDKSRISTISYGKERPAVLGSNEAAWAKNRRAVMVVK